MELHRLPADEAAVRRYIEELWLPYHHDLEAAVDAHALADDTDIVEEELDFRLDRLESEGYRAWVAVDGDSDGEAVPDAADSDTAIADTADSDTVIADVDAELAGFVTTEVEEAPSVFDRPDRLVVGDIYVREPYRGTGLADDLMDRAAERAREAGCAQVALDVDVDNERAIAFYEKLGFERHRHRMMVGTDEL